jgi:HSP20 family protein
MLVRVRERHPFADLRHLERDIDRIFRGSFGIGTATRGPRAVEVTPDADGVTLRVELPGVDPAKVGVTVENGTLSITGERSEEKRSDATALVRERAYGKFSHAFRVADDLDAEAISADCRDGVLSIRIPKRATVQPRQIEVKTS